MPDIYFALVIPILAGVYLIWKHRQSVVLWEPLIVIGACLIFIAIFKAGVETHQTDDVEYWGSRAVRVEYYEAWDERIHQTCTRSCGKNCTTTYDCSYTIYHSEYWAIADDLGQKIKISHAEHDRLLRQFGVTKTTFVDLHRNYYTNDGDKYIGNWDGSVESCEPVTTIHHYENRVQASASVFNYPEVTEEEKLQYKPYDYPELKQNHILYPILGAGKDAIEAQKFLDYENALLGKKKEIRMWVLLFKDQPIEAGMMQEGYWKGGNKNEFIVAIGMKGNKPAWCHPFSWSEIEEPKIRIRNWVMEQDTLDLMELSRFVTQRLNLNFKRKHFSEFSYLTVDPPFWAVLTTYVVTIILTILTSLWVVHNKITEDGNGYRNRF
jgi:hypothetical protein